MRNAGGELAERSELLGLHQAILRGAEVVERLRQVVGALAQFLQQPRIFDRDHSLLGKIAQEFDLLVAKQPNLVAIDRYRADHLVVPKHRHDSDRAGAAQFDVFNRRRGAFEIGLGCSHVGHVDHLLGADRLGQGALRMRGEDAVAPSGGKFGGDIVMSGRPHRAVFSQEHRPEFCTADARCVLQHLLEHGLPDRRATS